MEHTESSGSSSSQESHETQTAVILKHFADEDDVEDDDNDADADASDDDDHSDGDGNNTDKHKTSTNNEIFSVMPLSITNLEGEEELRPKLQNIVSTVNLKCKLDLKSIAMQARNAEYNPKRFAAVIMRIREPRTTALIFSSGKMVCTGAKSEEQCRLASRKYARIIQKLGFHTQFCDFKIQNIVGSCDVGFPVRLETIAFVHGTFSTYEPELFPGLVYRMIDPRIVILIFVSGKVVLTGAKVREEIYAAFRNIYPIIRKYRK